MSIHHRTVWTDEQQATLERMAQDGATAKEIGVILGFSRSAVCGRAGRTGVSLVMTAEKRARMHTPPVSRRPRPKNRDIKPASWPGFRPRKRGASAFTERERLMAISSFLAGMSGAGAARLIGAHLSSLKNWMKDEDLVERAHQVLNLATADARSRAEQVRRERMARFHEVMTLNERILSGFSERNADIIRRRLQGEMLSEAARRHDITGERARQILMKGIAAGIVAPPGVRLLNDRVPA